MEFNKPLTDELAFPAKPGSSQAARAQFMVLFNELKDAISLLVTPTTLGEHTGEVISQAIIATRDISLTGIQTISGLTNTPKRIEVRATTNDAGTSKNSIGSYEVNGQSSITIYKTGAGNIVSGFTPDAAIGIAVSEVISAAGTIQNITATSFDINWTKTGLPTGAAILQIVCQYH